jgi:hypothetical protein
MTLDFPWTVVAGDKAADLARKRHFRLIAAQLIAFLIVSLAGTGEGSVPIQYQQATRLAVPSFLGIGLAIQGIMRIKCYEKIWFDCRAVTESAKSAAWRYMMNAAPFEATASGVERKFLQEMNEIKAARPEVEPHLVAANVDALMLTESMRKVRASSLEERKSLYFDHRLNDQRKWYEGKTRESQVKSNTWFWTILALQGGAFAVSILQIESIPFPYYSILMTMAASFVAWSEARRYQETIQPYALAAHELRDAATLWTAASDEAALQELLTSHDVESEAHRLAC